MHINDWGGVFRGGVGDHGQRLVAVAGRRPIGVQVSDRFKTGTVGAVSDDERYGLYSRFLVAEVAIWKCGMNYAQLQQASASLMERVLGQGMCNPSKWAAPEGFPASPPLFQELRFKLPLFDATNPSLPTDQVDTANDNLVAGATLAACTPYADCLGDETSAYPRGFTTDGDMAGGGLTDNDVTVSQAGSSFDSVSNSQHDGIWDTQHDLVFEWATPQQEVQDYADGELKRVCMVRIYWGDVYAQDLDIYVPPALSLEVGKESPGRTGWTLRSRVRGQQPLQRPRRAVRRTRRDRHDLQQRARGGRGRQRRRAHKAGTPDASGPTSMYHEYMLDGCGSSDPRAGSSRRRASGSACAALPCCPTAPASPRLRAGGGRLAPAARARQPRRSGAVFHPRDPGGGDDAHAAAAAADAVAAAEPAAAAVPAAPLRRQRRPFVGK